MQYFHVFVKMKDKRGLFFFNFREENLKKAIASPYMENRPILIEGRFVSPSDIDMIDIFESDKAFDEIVLPNGKLAIDEQNSLYTWECFCMQKVKARMRYCTFDFITSPPQEEKTLMKLMESASFLDLGINWSWATLALQLQEIAMTKVAKGKGILLNKASVEKILHRKIESLSFSDQYEAFRGQVKALFGIGMPILTADLRRMRARVLHEGYDPTQEETESIVSFTVGLLQRMKGITEVI